MGMRRRYVLGGYRGGHCRLRDRRGYRMLLSTVHYCMQRHVYNHTWTVCNSGLLLLSVVATDVAEAVGSYPSMRTAHPRLYDRQRSHDRSRCLPIIYDGVGHGSSRWVSVRWIVDLVLSAVTRRPQINRLWSMEPAALSENTQARTGSCPLLFPSCYCRSSSRRNTE